MKGTRDIVEAAIVTVVLSYAFLVAFWAIGKILAALAGH